ncbi:cytochrome c oxidase subunit 2 [Phaeobacter inhibens]|uniref:cytochrome c oxidase subunit II n=1 Tax=Phaeobacter inhibens TaxID=221822 RepID=UPI000C9A37A0|nr:cytochrome c oxidase subunit II [Phaeobacter inhibens]AUQ67467.1 cytochrome c oxidase subunit 2 [Phaeobacter inhibens]AUR02607.1 cytochrome c oxidase subunit 2 [Phaeobacter inhibens]UWR49726.1 cytochrome c oxidase subunit II [Phaeobacter inhibens]UWR80903.1 cytochrome c oxidase subunit II [Phaeobacter inhibens]UWR93046.1 cytochrome c oxidase subunit II [Phaeobacter inhibens]
MKNALMLSGLFSGLSSLPAMAQEGLETIGKPVDGGLGFQPAATELAEGIHSLDYMILVIITAVCVFVGGLLLYAIVRFNRRANPNASQFTHNTPIEIAWTVVPILILVFIGSFSLPELFRQQEIPEGDITIKVTGYQWYWGYEYVDHGFGFDSYMVGSPASLDEDERAEDADVTPFVLDDAMRKKLVDAGFNEDEFLLATTTSVVVPVGKTVVMQVTGADVIHSWTIPAFGVKQDAVPGRLAELWFKADKEGIYFGQCSELCGKDHAYMPITVKVVSQEAYDAWLEGAIEEYAGLPQSYQVASN